MIKDKKPLRWERKHHNFYAKSMLVAPPHQSASQVSFFDPTRKSPCLSHASLRTLFPEQAAPQLPAKLPQ